MNPLITISLRHQAVYVPGETHVTRPLGETTGVLLANLSKLGFSVTEELKDALNGSLPTWQVEVLESAKAVLGVNKNWTPLVKGWDTPTGESFTDHLITWFVNLVGGRGTQLACGHIIPPGTFPLERYNGCPFCGTPFSKGEIEITGQGSSKKLLGLWRDDDLRDCLDSLLKSKTALDATQRESLSMLLKHLPLPDVEIGMKETRMLVVDALADQGRGGEAQRFFATPADVMRYLWFKKTGFLQVIEPRTIIQRKGKNATHLFQPMDRSKVTAEKVREELRLKYGRRDCHQAASWLNGLDLSPQQACEVMHPKRRMWVRFIRALRLVEWSKKPGFDRLAALLHAFHTRSYEVHAGLVQSSRLKKDDETAFRLLKQRPGLFARSLFANMLWFGPQKAIAAFSEVVDKVPARLVFSLQSMSEPYFSGGMRSVKPLGGTGKTVEPNKLLALYQRSDLEKMKTMIEDLCLLAMRKRFAALPASGKTMFIAPQLFKMPVSIGERSETVQDLPAALMGTRFPVLGDRVRLFMQWGVGMPAQHLDMDLSCRLAFDGREEICSFHQLTSTGCKHSGDIRSIPDKVGTAEYIEMDVAELRREGCKYVVFACNAYSWGSISPELVVGWMSSEHAMHISEKTGVAYDPSCVQHQVCITRSMSKGLVFGVLEVASHEIIWLEMPFGSQVAARLDTQGVHALLAKLNARLSVGNLLKLKAEAQGLRIVDAPGADEDYTCEWAINSAAVTALLVD
ncbi:MAG: hypothetical protein U1F71_07945 [Verrucomicrobiaceae bacterium]